MPPLFEWDQKLFQGKKSVYAVQPHSGLIKKPNKAQI